MQKHRAWQAEIAISTRVVPCAFGAEDVGDVDDDDDRGDSGTSGISGSRATMRPSTAGRRCGHARGWYGLQRNSDMDGSCRVLPVKGGGVDEAPPGQ